MGTGKAVLLLTLILPLIAGCGYPRSKFEKKTLPSGKEIRLLSTHTFYVESLQASGLEWKYETDLSTQDLPRLKEEVLDVWEGLRPELIREKLAIGVIIAREPPKKWGSFPDYQSHKFVFVKQKRGEWQLQY